MFIYSIDFNTKVLLRPALLLECDYLYTGPLEFCAL